MGVDQARRQAARAITRRIEERSATQADSRVKLAIVRQLDPLAVELLDEDLTLEAGSTMTTSWVVEQYNIEYGIEIDDNLLVERRSGRWIASDVISDVEAEQFDPGTYATVASPAFTGNPTAPTPSANDDDTSIATTGFVHDEITDDIAAAVAGTIADNIDAAIDAAIAGEIAGDIAAAVAASFLTGELKSMAIVGSVPTGWLECNGGLVSRSTYAALFAVMTETMAITTTNASNSITCADTSNIRVGANVEGTGVGTAAVVTSITNATTFVVSVNSTASATVSGRFLPFGDGDGSTTFKLPDLRSRAPTGENTSNKAGVGNNVGQNDGVSAASRTTRHGHTMSTKSTYNVTGAATAVNSSPTTDTASPFQTVRWFIKT